MSWKSTATILFALFALYAPNAAASDTFDGLSEGTRSSLEVDEYGELITFDLVGQVAVLPKLMLDVDVPWGLNYQGGGGDWFPALFGNLRLGAHSAFHATPNIVLHLGGSVTAPTNSHRGDGTGEFGTAAKIRGYFDLDHFLPQTVALRVPFGAEFQFGPFVYLRSELTPVVLVPTGHLDRDYVGAQVLLEHSDEVEIRSRPGWGGGVRFQVVVGLTRGLPLGPDLGREDITVGPFLAYEPPGHGVFARAGVSFSPWYIGDLPAFEPFAHLRIGYKF